MRKVVILNLLDGVKSFKRYNSMLVIVRILSI